MYDFLIVGAGFYGATFAYEATKKGYKCLVVDIKSHIGGLSYTEYDAETDVNVHKYGAHIFHTNSDRVWEFVNQFTTFNNYQHRVKAIGKDGSYYSFPINLLTLNELGYDIRNPRDAIRFWQSQRNRSEKSRHEMNAEEWLIHTYGENIYEIFFKYYTIKQYGISPSKLPASIVRRIRFRADFDDLYFPNSKYQGIPIGGYTQLIKNMLEGIDVALETDYFEINKQSTSWTVKCTVFTGPIDKFYSYIYGVLGYNSLIFKHYKLPSDKSQGCAVINHCTNFGPLRTIEHRYFDMSHKTQLRNAEIINISEDHPANGICLEPMYPIMSDENMSLYHKYKSIFNPSTIFGGRIGGYKYLDMDQAINYALLETDKLEDKYDRSDNLYYQS